MPHPLQKQDIPPSDLQQWIVRGRESDGCKSGFAILPWKRAAKLMHLSNRNFSGPIGLEVLLYHKPVDRVLVWPCGVHRRKGCPQGARNLTDDDHVGAHDERFQKKRSLNGTVSQRLK